MYSLLFDLDGTLIESAPDIANALNMVKEGRVAGLGVTTLKRDALLPDMPTVAGVVAAGIDAVLGPQATYHIVGFSFGASVGGHLALQHGARVRTLNLLGAGGLVKPNTPITLDTINSSKALDS